MLKLKNAGLIPELTEDYAGEHADIILDGDRISAITIPGATNDDIPYVDLSGKFVIPALLDLHMHLYFAESDFYKQAAKNVNQNILDSVAYANAFLDMGYTTLRDCGNPHYLGVDLRDAFEAGKISGPRVLTAGKCISPYAKGNNTFPDLYYEANTAEEVNAAGRDEFAKGVDFLKYTATGSVANKGGVPGALISSAEEIQALQRVVSDNGSYAAVHCHGTQGIKLCIQSGIRTIEHASFITDECIEMILKNGGMTCIVPTLAPVMGVHNEFKQSGQTGNIADKIEECYNAASGLVKAARAGVLTGWGSDISMETFNKNPGAEFLARQQVGFSNLEILKQATINSAMILRLDDIFGTVKIGKSADLIVIEENPLENMNVMTKKPLYVFKAGKRMR